MKTKTGKPLKNSEHKIEITDVTAKGFGVGNIHGFTIFVDGALPGDNLRILILKVKTSYGYGKILEIVSPSPWRIASPCNLSGHCGGCQFQHCEYSEQLHFKKRLVLDALERIGGVKNPPVLDVFGMDEPFNYRNKAVFPVVPSEDSQGFAIGMYAARSHRIVRVSECIIQHPAHVFVLNELKEHMKTHKISPYDETIHKGLVRHVIIRTSLSTGEIMVVLVINGESLPMEQDFCEKLTEHGATTVIINPNKSKGNVILGDKFRVLSGTGFIHERIGHVEYGLSAQTFFQVNPVQTKILYDTAVSQAGLTGTEIVMDAHVGAGGIALYTANKAKKIIGVDIVSSAISDAQKNAALNGVQNAKFICGAAEEIIPEMLANAEESNLLIPDVIFLDPPRKGCEPELLNAIIAAKIEKIVYVSCDPATLARDIKMLVAGGYQVVVAQPVDMFPMTGKVETSVLLVIK